MSILLFRFCNKIGTVKHLWTFTVSSLYGRIKWTLRISVLTCLKTRSQNGRSHCPYYSFYTYVVDIQNGRSTREATVCLPVQPGLPFPLTAGGSGSCSLRYLGYFPSPFMPGGCGTVKKDAASPRKCGVRRRFAAPSDQRMALNFARKSRVKKPFWMRSPNEPFAPTLCRVYVSLMPGAAQSSTTRCSLSSRAAWR